jgi:hypothetical protein
MMRNFDRTLAATHSLVCSIAGRNLIVEPLNGVHSVLDDWVTLFKSFTEKFLLNFVSENFPNNSASKRRKSSVVRIRCGVSENNSTLDGASPGSAPNRVLLRLTGVLPVIVKINFVDVFVVPFLGFEFLDDWGQKYSVPARKIYLRLHNNQKYNL